eukprot:TRINITY_DN4330_c0_g1_i1.p1 TRINITY_DN4330_c0_g1~~TRINITY_DN4330_c0_g1_i1.p1  ORF type:complete len:338 (-),score=62.10 TRINITY_DN4330_c0_g1_i1:54-1067(-)
MTSKEAEKPVEKTVEKKEAEVDKNKDKKLIDDVVSDFKTGLEKTPEAAVAVIAIQALTGVVKRSKATTMMGLEKELISETEKLKSCMKTSISVASACELFNQYVTRVSEDVRDFELTKAKLIERGTRFAKISAASRQEIAELVDRFIRDNQVVLIHGFSRVVCSALIFAAKEGRKSFSVYVTESRPDCAGYKAAKEFLRYKIPVTLILDSAIGYVMDSVDFVLMGAEGVVESGGIINKIGSFPIAMAAKAFKKPFYVASESYKFARHFPLNQKDLPETKSDQPKLLSASKDDTLPPNLTTLNPSCDYTPPEFITLLFTDLGILTPSAVSDELIKLYS